MSTPGRACRHGAACYDPECTFVHPAGRASIPAGRPCRHGAACYEPECRFVHPAGRATPPSARDVRLATRQAAAASQAPKPALQRTAGPAAAAAAAASSSSAAAAAPASSSASYAPRPGPFPSTTAPCPHTDPAHEHCTLPHSGSVGKGVWAATQAALRELDEYYIQHVQRAPRGRGEPEAKQDDDTEMSSASQAMDADDGEGGANASLRAPPAPKRIWSRHYIPVDAPAPPVKSSAALVELLRSVRHPAFSRHSFTGDSLRITLDEVAHPGDRAHFLQVVLPFLAHTVLQLPALFPQATCCLPLMVRGQEQSVTLSAAQCAAIVACQFFSLLPPKEGPAAADDEDDDDGSSDSWPGANMDSFLSVRRAPMSGKHLLVFNYFARIERAEENATLAQRFVTFHRRVLEEEQCASIDDNDLLCVSEVPLSRVSYRDRGCIEDAEHSLQVDFANKFIGGGVLYTGCVQEEIRFCLSPECLVSMALCEVMSDNEAIILVGPKMFSHYEGYGTDLSFGRDCPDEGLEQDEWGRNSNCIVAIDALDYMHNGGSARRSASSQWQGESMRRETLKAYAGFSLPQALLGSKFLYDCVATGNWGCGAFGGYVPHKFLLQWIASSLARRGLIYYSFGNALAKGIPEFVSFIEGLKGPPATVGEVWRALEPVASAWGNMRKNQIQAASPEQLLEDLKRQMKENRER